MNISVHQGGVVMSSQLTFAPSPITHPSADIPGTCSVIFSSFALLKSTPTASCTASRSSPGDNHQSAVRKNAGPSKNGRVKNSIIYICMKAVDPSYTSIVAQPPPSSLSCPWPFSCHSSNLTSVYPVPALCLHSPSTPF